MTNSDTPTSGLVQHAINVPSMFGTPVRKAVLQGGADYPAAARANADVKTTQYVFTEDKGSRQTASDVVGKPSATQVRSLADIGAKWQLSASELVALEAGLRRLVEEWKKAEGVYPTEDGPAFVAAALKLIMV